MLGVSVRRTVIGAHFPIRVMRDGALVDPHSGLYRTVQSCLPPNTPGCDALMYPATLPVDDTVYIPFEPAAMHEGHVIIHRDRGRRVVVRIGNVELVIAPEKTVVPESPDELGEL